MGTWYLQTLGAGLCGHGNRWEVPFTAEQPAPDLPVPSSSEKC